VFDQLEGNRGSESVCPGFQGHSRPSAPILSYVSRWVYLPENKICLSVSRSGQFNIIHNELLYDAAVIQFRVLEMTLTHCGQSFKNSFLSLGRPSTPVGKSIQYGAALIPLSFKASATANSRNDLKTMFQSSTFGQVVHSVLSVSHVACCEPEAVVVVVRSRAG
jgi:hypothetical protein